MSPRQSPAGPRVRIGFALAPLFVLAMGVTAVEAQAPDGAKIFSEVGCSGCHGAQGQGAVGPQLAGNDDLSDAEAVAHQIIEGGGGMPPFGDRLSDTEIAAVATYIRTNLGNSFGEVTEQQVADVRASGGEDDDDGNDSD